MYDTEFVANKGLLAVCCMIIKFVGMIVACGTLFAIAIDVPRDADKRKRRKHFSTCALFIIKKK